MVAAYKSNKAIAAVRKQEYNSALGAICSVASDDAALLLHFCSTWIENKSSSKYGAIFVTWPNCWIIVRI